MTRQGYRLSSFRPTKLTPPRLPVILNRTRLFRLLDQTTKSPLTWIAAPPGAGKTTLLASYLQSRKRQDIWYRLDGGDADPSTLFHYLGLAVHLAAPRFRSHLPNLTPEYMAGLPTFTQRFFEHLSSRFQRSTIIVFDNYHEVPMDAVVHRLLPVGIQQLPHHIRMVVLSRERPPVGFARLQAENHLTIIEPSKLEVTRDEAYQLSRLRGAADRKKDAKSSVDCIWELTKGWIAGFTMMSRHIQRDRSVPTFTTDQSRKIIFDYLAEEVMERFPRDTQVVLMSVSILSDFTPEMAHLLASVPQAADILEQLHQFSYFVERRDDDRGWYRFHPLFQDFLFRRAERTWSPTTLRERRRKAAAILVEAHREEDAISLLRQCEAWDDYCAIVRAQAPILVQQGRTQTLETWIGQLPAAQREVDPWMDFWVANSRLFVAPREASVLYESAMTRFRRNGERAAMLLAWSGAVQSILIAWAGMKRVHDLVRLFHEIYMEGDGYPSLEVEAVVAQAMAGAYMHLYPDQPKARQWLDRSVQLAHALPPSMRGSEIVMTTIYYLWLGDVETAHAISAEQRRVCANHTSASMRLMLATTEATLSWYSGQVEHCREAVHNGLARIIHDA